jgi:hypothetical protein
MAAISGILTAKPGRRKCSTFRRGQVLPTFSPEGPLAVRFQRLHRANATRSQIDGSEKGVDFFAKREEFVRISSAARINGVRFPTPHGKHAFMHTSERFMLYESLQGFHPKSKLPPGQEPLGL